MKLECILAATLIPLGCSADDTTGENLPDSTSGEQATTTLDASTSADPSGTESSGTTIGGEESSAEGSESGGVGSSCGDGSLDPSEACDDGNGIEEDGCTTQCVVSGTLLWTWTPTRGEELRAGSFTPTGELSIVTTVDGAGTLRRFDPEGVEIEALAIDGLQPPDDASDSGLAHVDVASSDGGAFVAFGYEWPTPEGYLIAGRIEFTGDDPWVREVDDGISSVALRPSGGAFVRTTRGGLLALDAAGTTDWHLTDLGTVNDIQPLSDGVLAIHGSRVVARADDGSELWTNELDAQDDVTFVRGGVSSEEIWLWGYVGTPSSDNGRLARLSSDGTVLEVLEQEDPGSANAVTAEGNLVRLRNRGVRIVEKFTPALDLQWSHDFELGGWSDLAVDNRGTVAAMTTTELRVLAP